MIPSPRRFSRASDCNAAIESSVYTYIRRPPYCDSVATYLTGYSSGPVLRPPNISQPEYSSLDPEESQLLKAYASLLSNEQLSDVTITVGTRKFYAQRAILSVRSAVFAAMFQSGMQESKPNCTISVKDIEPDVFQEVLRFIYTDQVKGLETMAHELLAAADKYALDHLMNMCVKHLCCHVSKKTVLQTLVQADLYRIQQLKDTAIRFICGNVKQMHAADWKGFCETNPGLAAEMFGKM